jgi:hypothetical protein
MSESAEAMADWIPLSRFCQLTGYQSKEARSLLRRGYWTEGVHIKNVADEDPLVDLTAISRWMESGPPTEGRPVHKPSGAHSQKHTALYRHFDSTGKLLYVGISLNPFERLQAHMIDSHWCSKISSITIEWFDTRRRALDAEMVAIGSEDPAHNVMRPVRPEVEFTAEENAENMAKFESYLSGASS